MKKFDKIKIKLGKKLKKANKEEKEQKKALNEFLELTKKGFYKLEKNYNFNRDKIYFLKCKKIEVINPFEQEQ